MNYYAIISFGNDCDSFTSFVTGNLSSIVECLLDESNEAIYSEGMSLKEYEEWYHCDFDSYRKLKRIKKHFREELIQNYYFQLSDMYVSTTAIAHTPEEIENLINTFIDEKNLKYILKSKLMTDEDVNSAFFELESIYEMHRENKESENTRFFSKEELE